MADAPPGGPGTPAPSPPPAPAPQPQPVTNLAAFIAIAQHEVQKVTEYLSRSELRRVDAVSPAYVMPMLGVLRMRVPVQMWQAAAPVPGQEAVPPSDPEQLLVPGLVWPPRSQQAWTIAVRTLGNNSQAAGDCVGYVELEFTPCPKQ